MVLTDFVSRNVLCEQALYLSSKKYEYMIVMVSTDDLLIFYHDSSIFSRILVHMRKCLTWKYQEGTLLKFLNIQIFQLKHGMRFYHNPHIKNIIDVCLSNPNVTIKDFDTLFLTYNTYEHEMT